ncbi:MAG TPA: hypothetical protein VHQ43_04305 [Solirubrobacterales bacterium]|jgi:hypothetical protein|nr:hypothetical protein [Solirubrobacterales bacterium]
MSFADRPSLLRGAFVGLALLVALVAWLATRGDTDEPVAAEETAQTRVVSAADLGDAAALNGHPVYWAGPIAGTALELTESEGDVQVRYLEDDSEAGGESAAALTVGSYPLADPAGAIRTLAGEPGATVRRSKDGREVVVSSENPTSAYFASPDDSVQVEVYDPSPKRALALALSPKVRPAG